MLKYFVHIILILFAVAASAQQNDAMVTKSFVIVASVKNYLSAKTSAENAAKQLQLKLDWRGLGYHKKTGLSFSKQVCENDGGFPCYIARGRYDDGAYVSVEWSNAINGFAKGYYVVIIYSGEKEEALKILAAAKIKCKDAYCKTTSVYMGCMH